MHGFTLVEMLVALFIFALLTAAGVTVMRFTSDNQAVLREHSDRLAQFQRTRAILKADLSQAVARRTRDAAGRVIRASFSGASQPAREPLLRFVRRGWDNPDGQPRASLQQVEYRLAGTRLERSARWGLDGGRAGPAQVLADGVTSARIAFLWRGQWIDALPGGPQDPLPQALRLDLVIDGTGAVSQLFLVTGESL